MSEYIYATNGEWLDYLAHNAPDELAAWFDAERITNQAEMSHMPESHESVAMQQIRQVIEGTVKRGVYGDTEPENEDSRDKLEADVREWISIATYKAFTPERMLEVMIHWLNRQRAIDDSICDECSSDYYEMQEEHDHMIDGIAKLMRLKQPYTFDPGEPFKNIETIGRYIDELTAERDKLKELNEYHALQYELASEDADRLQAQVDRLTAERDNLADDLLTVNRQCEQYRKKLSNVMDAVHEAYRVGS